MVCLLIPSAANRPPLTSNTVSELAEGPGVLSPKHGCRSESWTAGRISDSSLRSELQSRRFGIAIFEDAIALGLTQGSCILIVVSGSLASVPASFLIKETQGTQGSAETHCVTLRTRRLRGLNNPCCCEVRGSRPGGNDGVSLNQRLNCFAG